MSHTLAHVTNHPEGNAQLVVLDAHRLLGGAQLRAQLVRDRVVRQQALPLLVVLGELVEVGDDEAQADNADDAYAHDAALARRGEALKELSNLVVCYSRKNKVIYEVFEVSFFVSHAVSNHSPNFRDLLEVSDAEAHTDKADDLHDTMRHVRSMTPIVS